MNRAFNITLDAALMLAACALLFFCYRPLAQQLTAALRGSQTQGASFGSNDLIEYWSAYRIAERGENPYRLETMLAEQRTVNPARTEPLMMWNPPWLLVMMSPVLHSDFATASKRWLISGIWITLLTLLLCRWLRASENTLSGFGLVLLSFPPLWQSLSLGQSSILLLPSVLAFYLLMQRGKYAAAGIAVSLCTIKPHLFCLLWLYLLWWTARTKKPSLLLGFSASLLLLALVAYLRFPHAFTAWLQLVAPSTAVAPQVVPTRWKTATLASALAALAGGTAEAQFHELFRILIPCASVLAVLFGLTRIRPARDSVGLIPGLLCLSLFTAPFGWFFDQVSLAGAYMELRGVRALSLVLMLNALITYLSTNIFVWQHQLFWYPLIPLAFFLTHAGTRVGERGNPQP